MNKYLKKMVRIFITVVFVFSLLYAGSISDAKSVTIYWGCDMATPGRTSYSPNTVFDKGLHLNPSWSFDVQDPKQILTTNEKVYVISTDFVVALEQSSGKQLWKYDSHDPITSACLDFAGDVWLGVAGDINGLVEINERAGIISNIVNLNTHIYHLMNVYDDFIFVGLDLEDEKCFVERVRPSGEISWKHEVESTEYVPSSDGAVIVITNVVDIENNERETVGIDFDSGTIIWKDEGFKDFPFGKRTYTLNGYTYFWQIDVDTWLLLRRPLQGGFALNVSIYKYLSEPMLLVNTRVAEALYDKSLITIEHGKSMDLVSILEDEKSFLFNSCAITDEVLFLASVENSDDYKIELLNPRNHKLLSQIGVNKEPILFALGDSKLLVAFSDSIVCYAPGEVDESKVIRVEITPENVTVKRGGTVQFRAKAYNALGEEIESAVIKWSVDPAAGGTISSSGLFILNFVDGLNEIKITAECDGVKATAQVQVVLDITKIEIAEQNPIVASGGGVKLEAVGFDGDGEPIDGLRFKWEIVGDPMGNTITDNGVFKATGKDGVFRVRASAYDLSASVDVRVLTPSKVVVEPGSAAIEPGKTIQFNAKVLDANEYEVPNVHVVWSVTPPTVGKIDENGLFTPSDNGHEGKVKATFGKVFGEAKLFVNPLVLTESIDFGEVEFGDVATQKIKISNITQCDVSVSLKKSAFWMGIEKTEWKVAPGVPVFVDVELDTNKVEPDSYLIGFVTIDWGGGSKRIQVSAYIKPKKEFERVKVDFGFVPRGETKKIEIDLTKYDKIDWSKVINKPCWVSFYIQEEWAVIGEEDSDPEQDNLWIEANPSKAPKGTEFSDSFYLELTNGEGVYFDCTMTTEEDIKINLVVGNNTADVNGRDVKLDSSAQIVGGRTMLPLRFIGETLGCDVGWYPDEKRIELDRNGFLIKLWIGKDTAEVDGETVKLDQPPQIISGRTVVPVRFISESFGAKVEWIDETKTVKIFWEPT